MLTFSAQSSLPSDVTKSNNRCCGICSQHTSHDNFANDLVPSIVFLPEGAPDLQFNNQMCHQHLTEFILAQSLHTLGAAQAADA